MSAEASGSVPREERRYASKTVDERRGDRRRRLMDAALDAFGNDGYRGVSIEALCSRATISTRNFYEEFESREALLLALHDDVNERALTAVAESLNAQDPDDVTARVTAATNAYFDVMTSDRRWARIALVETVGVSPAAEAHRRAAIDRFVTFIEVEADRLASDGVIERRNFHLTAIALAGALTGLVSTWTGDAEWDNQVPLIRAEASRLIEVSLRG
ncbi:MAG: TetR/AcrR family transcriptional regulator [Aeromicrobium sp.]